MSIVTCEKCGAKNRVDERVTVVGNARKPRRFGEAPARMTPLPDGFPTAQPVVASEKSMDLRLFVVGVDCELQVMPPSVLTNMPPLSETAKMSISVRLRNTAPRHRKAVELS